MLIDEWLDSEPFNTSPSKKDTFTYHFGSDVKIFTDKFTENLPLIASKFRR